MNKIIRGALILSILTSMTRAEGMYFSGGVSIEDADVKDNGIAVELGVGKVFYNNFGIEGKLTKTVKSPEEKEDGIKGEIDIMTLSVFATYSHVLTPEFTIMPKIGFTQFSTDVELSDNFGDSLSLDDSNINLSYGIDVKYKMGIDTNLYLGYTIYNSKFKDGPIDDDLDASHLSVGIQKRF